jgi:hypothetical protein
MPSAVRLPKNLTELIALSSSKRFNTILDEMRALHDRKAKDYGSNEDPLYNLRATVALGIKPWVGCLIRMNDKMYRLQRFAKRGSLANESAIDSLNDIAVYAILARILMEEEQL